MLLFLYQRIQYNCIIFYFKNCKEHYASLKRKCSKCGSSVIKIIKDRKTSNFTTTKGEKYFNLGEDKNINLPKCQVGEPILLNPNSYENIEVFFDIWNVYHFYSYWCKSHLMNLVLLSQGIYFFSFSLSDKCCWV